ncbi:MAG: hypothetical protein KDA80_16075 [Planctomycetaceae bacterium]|nr:hypothetical protein [Planctomycetaceae bacterium]
MKVVFIGDTSLNSRHFGCQLVCQTFREQFARLGLTEISSHTMELPTGRTWKEVVAPADCVIINGEGSLHHGRFLSVLDVAKYKPTALVNCVYQENPYDERIKSLIYVSARESLSAAALKEHGIACDVTPDVLFASQRLGAFVKPEPRHDLGRTDNAVKNRFSLGPIRFSWRPGFSPKVARPEDYLAKLCQYRRLCIGRFHAAIAASRLGIPFATWDSNTWKTRGLMKDMGVEHLHFDDYESAKEHVPVEFDPRIAKFAQEATRRIETMFDRAIQAVRAA